MSVQAVENRYFLAGCRLAPYKRIDLVVEAFKNLGDNYKLKIFGDGVDLKRLQKITGTSSNIEFLGRVSEEEKAKLFSGAQAFINPQEEDFGITVIESMASGRPVIAYRRGGATETVIEGKTGVFFDEADASSLEKAIRSFRSELFNPEEIRRYAKHFSVENYKNSMFSFIKEHKKEV